MACKHPFTHGYTYTQNGETLTTEKCSECAATRTYSRTYDGFMLGGHWEPLDGYDVVKRKGQQDEQRKGTPY